MQDVWLQIYPYGDYPAIRLNAGKDDYLLEAATGCWLTERHWVDLNGIASGGEKSIACLAMRISMSMVIVPNLRWLILDEPTHNIDENGINKLVQSTRRVAAEDSGPGLHNNARHRAQEHRRGEDLPARQGQGEERAHLLCRALDSRLMPKRLKS